MTQSGKETDNRGATGIRGWALAILAICALWLAGMVAASYFGLEYKTPTRIENWRPAPAVP